MINRFKIGADDWCRFQSHRSKLWKLLLSSPINIYRECCSFLNKTKFHWYEPSSQKRVWLPWFTLVITFIAYGINELIYIAAAKQYHYRNVPLFNTIINLAVMVIITSVLLYIALYVQKYCAGRTKAVRANYKWWINICYGIIASWLIPNLVYSLCITFFGIRQINGANQNTIDNLAATNSVGIKIWLVIMMVIIAPVMEELIFRFLMIGPRTFYKTTYNKYLRWFMIVLSLLFFAYEHISPQLSVVNWNNINSVLSTLALTLKYLVMGMIFTYIYVRSNDIKASITTHIGMNLISLLLITMT